MKEEIIEGGLLAVLIVAAFIAGFFTGGLFVYNSGVHKGYKECLIDHVVPKELSDDNQ